MSENSELFKKLDPGAQFQWERVFPAVQPRSSLRGSEAKLTNSSRYSSFRGRERLLDPRRLRRAFRRSRTNSVSPKGLRRPSAFGSDWRRGSLTQLSSPHCIPRQGSAQLCKSFSTTCVRTIVLPPPQSNLERDCLSASRLRQRKYSSVKNQGEDVHGACHRPAL